MIFIGILIFILVAFILYFAISTLEYLYVYVFKRPFYTHLYFRPKSLPPVEEVLLQTHFPFYRKLNQRQQKFFQHRLILFIQEKNFEGRDGFQVTQEVKILISATAIMLTFGMRNFFMGVMQKIIIYPEAYYSQINQTYHKGEFNPRMRVLVFSWKDFLHGMQDRNDNLNLGIHEFVHVLQFNSNKFRDISASIFSDTSKSLEKLLKNEELRSSLLSSDYLRDYAFTNRIEFLAVLVEYFIESPQEFKRQFPLFYKEIKEMLNFRFAGY